jgi:hypothetical protein
VASLTATGQGVTVVIQNSGDGPVTDSFWSANLLTTYGGVLESN